MKWRNQILALFCLVLFALFGVFYVRHWVVQKPFGIVLFLTEGLTPSRIAAARVYIGGAENLLAIDAMPHIALLRNSSADFAVPDAAAAASAIATGVKVQNGVIAQDADGNALANLLDAARASGRAVGLVTTGRLTDATPASFYAHAPDSTAREKIAGAILESGTIDVVLGGGTADFLPATKGGERTDERDLLMELRQAGYEVVRTRAELENIPGWRKAKLFGVFSDDTFAFADEREGREEQPSLADLVRRSIELLQFNRGGYLLVVDAALSRKATRANQGEYALSEFRELDRAVATAQSYVGRTSTVLVCGDVVYGGLLMSGFPFREDRGMAVIGPNPAGDPWLTWATGPQGTRSYGAKRIDTADPEAPAASPSATGASEPAAVFAGEALPVVSDTLAFGSGPAGKKLSGSIESTAIFDIIRDSL